MRFVVVLLPLLGCAFDAGGVESAGPPSTDTLGSASTSSSTGPVDPSTTSSSTTSDADGTSTGGTSTSGDDDTTTTTEPVDPTEGSNTEVSDTDPSTTTGEPTKDDECNGEVIPKLSASGGPISEVSIDNARFAETDTNIVFADPGGYVELSFDYQIASCECTGCITQGMMGVVDGQWRDCFFDATPGCNQQFGSASMSVQAPSEPGFYPISFWRTWQFDCEYDVGGPGPDAIAGICVTSG